MATRCTTTEYQPSPPNYTRNHGKVVGRIGIRFSATSGFRVQPNMCCPPATNGDRASGLAPSHPASTKKMLKIAPSW